MKLTEIIHPGAIVPDLQATDRDGVIRELVAALVDSGGLPADAAGPVVEAVIERESRGSTGFGRGVAVPHAKNPAIKHRVGAVGRSAAGVDFNALDHQPVYSVVLLLTPAERPQEHLQAMEVVFRNLQQDMFRRFLRQADTVEAVRDLLAEADGK